MGDYCWMSNIRIKYDFHTLDRMYNALRQFNDKKILALDPYVNGIIFYDFTILYFEDFHYATHLGYDFSKTFPDGRKFKIELNKVSKGMYEIKIAKDMIYEYRLLDSDDFSTIETEVKSELLDKLKQLDPYFFEKVILILLKRMGYGDFIATSKSGDGGVDGIINEDKLGLEKIYTQPKKCTENKVREKDIRNFIGAMNGDTTKGVFITTSTFDDLAIKKAREAHHSIILIDGSKLVDLMHQYDVGVQVKTTYKIKELDNDFFEGE